jgi:hypothetical protein
MPTRTERLHPDDLELLGIYLFGPRWQTALARAIGRDPRLVRRWVAAQRQVSHHASARIVALTLDKHKARIGRINADFLYMVASLCDVGAKECLLQGTGGFQVDDQVRRAAIAARGDDPPPVGAERGAPDNALVSNRNGDRPISHSCPGDRSEGAFPDRPVRISHVARKGFAGDQQRALDISVVQFGFSNAGQEARLVQLRLGEPPGVFLPLLDAAALGLPRFLDIGKEGGLEFVGPSRGRGPHRAFRNCPLKNARASRPAEHST